MNKHLQNYQTYQKHLARKERLISYLDSRPEARVLEDICSFLGRESKKLLGSNWWVREEGIDITENEIRIRFSWREDEEKKLVLPLWFLDDPDRYYKERSEEEKKKMAAKKEEAKLWEKFKAEHGKR